MINIKNILKVLMVVLFICVWSGETKAADENVDTGQVANTVQASDFCSSDLGIFSELVKTGRKIFRQLRDLIYVVAGFGIIAVAVGGFLGNFNWRWLGAIVISLVVIGTAGELIVLLTGCEEFSKTLVTNTLSGEKYVKSNEGWVENPLDVDEVYWSEEWNNGTGLGENASMEEVQDYVDKEIEKEIDEEISKMDEDLGKID